MANSPASATSPTRTKNTNRPHLKTGSAGSCGSRRFQSARPCEIPIEPYRYADTMIDFLSTIGRRLIDLFSVAGRLALFVASAFSHCVRPPFYFGNIAHQFWTIGYNSLPV